MNEVNRNTLCRCVHCTEKRVTLRWVSSGGGGGGYIGVCVWFKLFEVYK